MNRPVFVVTFGGLYLAVFAVAVAAIWFGSGPL